MVKRLATSAALLIALAATPSGGQAQISASVSFQMGLFDGVGMGLAVSSWGGSSIFSPGFHVGFGASVGLGVGSYAGSGYGYYDDGYYYDDYYDYGYNRYSSWYRYHRSYSPFYCRWWGQPNPCYGPWGPYGGFYFSLGMAWDYYRRPVYFDPWWGSVGYYARWRPAWVYDPGWYYYYDPYWAAPGYVRVAYVVPSRGYIYTTAPHAGYGNTYYKERADRVADNPRQAKPRESGSVTGTGVTRPSPTGEGRAVAQPGTEGPRNGGVARPGTPGTETGRNVPGAGGGTTGASRVNTPSTRAGNGVSRVAAPGRGSATPGTGASRPSTPSVFNPRRPTDIVRGQAGTERTPSARVPSDGRSSAGAPSARVQSGGRSSAGTPSAWAPNTRSPSARAPGARAPSARTPSARTPSSGARSIPQAAPGTQGTVRSTPGRTPTARVPSSAPSTRSAPGRAPSATAPSRGGSTRSPTVRAPSGGSRIAPGSAPRASVPNRSVPNAKSAPSRGAPTRTSPPKVRRPGGGGN